jgi:hypothetical protein
MRDGMYGHAGGEWQGLTSVLHQEMDDETHTGDTRARSQRGGGGKSSSEYASIMHAMFDSRAGGKVHAHTSLD